MQIPITIVCLQSYTTRPISPTCHKHQRSSNNSILHVNYFVHNKVPHSGCGHLFKPNKMFAFSILGTCLMVREILVSLSISSPMVTLQLSRLLMLLSTLSLVLSCIACM